MEEVRETQNTEVTENTETTPPEPRVFSQDDVNKIVGNRAKEAEQRAINTLLKKAGAQSVDEILGKYKEHKEYEEKTKSETERLQEQLQQLTQEREQKVAQANKRVIDSELRVALLAAGINPQRVTQAMRQVETGALEVDENGKVQGLDEAVQSVKESVSEWFGGGIRIAPETAPKETPRVDFQTMPSEEFQKISQQVLSGQKIDIP